MMRAVIGGATSRFAPYADLYRRALTELGAAGAPPRGTWASRFDLKYSNGTLPHEDLMETIRLGTEVIPRVRELLS